MSFSKKTRDIVYNKTNGKCAYCGCDLKKGWNIDHVVPVLRDFVTKEYTGDGDDDLGNLLPTCSACNNFKSCSDLEYFRGRITSTKVKKIRKKFDADNNKSIVFYYEKIGIKILSLYKYYLSKEEKRLKQELENLDYYYKNIKTCIYDLDLARQRINNCKKNIALYKNSINEIIGDK